MAFQDKAPIIQATIDKMALDTFGMKVSVALDKGVCLYCKEEPELPDTEWSISGICSPCYNKLFGGG